MKHILIKIDALSIVAAVSLVTLMVADKTPAQVASRGTPPTSVERREDLSNRQATEYEIESSGREPKEGPARAADRKHSQEVAEQIKHDFAGLQENHNQIVLFMAEKEGLSHNHDSLLRAIATIKKCAARLRTNLALPKAQQEKVGTRDSGAGENEQLQATLITLRQHIYNFVTNPLFEKPGALDLEQGRKASLDLDRIIELSESIRKSADKQKQSAKP